MQQADVVIVGGGIAGSTAAAMLGRAGIDTVLIDPSAVYPPDFRCEKLEEGQLRRLKKTGLGEVFIPRMTLSPELWIARYGVVVDRRPALQADARYEGMVRAMRDAVGGSARLRVGKVADIQASGERQRLTLRDGEEISARLVVLACGPGRTLLRKLGMEREVLSAAHSVSVGFDMAPTGGGGFPFHALTWYPHRAPPRISYLTLFPIGGVMRANLFVYWPLSDARLERLKAAPDETLRALLPGLDAVTGPAEIVGPVRLRQTDLYETRGAVREGVVLVGDAFASSCPAAGTGLDKVFTDVERLCSTHIPQWLSSPGMGKGKIAAFYEDPEKVACDVWSLERAYQARSSSVDMALRSRLRRQAAFWGQRVQGAVRRLRSGAPR